MHGDKVTMLSLKKHGSVDPNYKTVKLQGWDSLNYDSILRYIQTTKISQKSVVNLRHSRKFYVIVEDLRPH